MTYANVATPGGIAIVGSVRVGRLEDEHTAAVVELLPYRATAGAASGI
jgi:hypothetical protein